MGKNTSFYIGWQESMPDDQRRFLKPIVIIILALFVLITAAAVFLQKPFNRNTFEFGSLTEITGTYFSEPYPMLVADEGSLPDSLSPHVLLVGYGKFGAKGIMDQIATEKGSIEGKQVALAGTLIYGDGKTLMELTEQAASIRAIMGPGKVAVQSGPVDRPATAALYGEIIDPKCYFGVMKPGEGKIHKSCAIRCISGGIPPVFRVDRGPNSAGFDYFLLKSPEGSPLREELLPFVAERIAIPAESRRERLNGWDVLYISPDQIVERD